MGNERWEIEATEMRAGMVEQLTALFARLDDADDDAEAERDEIDNYPLSLEYDAERDAVRLIICTGGPHEELRWHQRPYGQACDIFHVYMPWFGRVETPIDRDAEPVIARFCDWFAEIIGPEFFEER